MGDTLAVLEQSSLRSYTSLHALGARGHSMACDCPRNLIGEIHPFCPPTVQTNLHTRQTPHPPSLPTARTSGLSWRQRGRGRTHRARLSEASHCSHARKGERASEHFARRGMARRSCLVTRGPFPSALFSSTPFHLLVPPAGAACCCWLLLAAAGCSTPVACCRRCPPMRTVVGCGWVPLPMGSARAREQPREVKGVDGTPNRSQPVHPSLLRAAS